MCSMNCQTGRVCSQKVSFLLTGEPAVLAVTWTWVRNHVEYRPSPFQLPMCSGSSEGFLHPASEFWFFSRGGPIDQHIAVRRPKNNFAWCWDYIALIIAHKPVRKILLHQGFLPGRWEQVSNRATELESRSWKNIAAKARPISASAGPVDLSGFGIGRWGAMPASGHC
jgi:hypothetical protein